MSSLTIYSLQSDKDYFIECSHEAIQELQSSMECNEREIEYLRDEVDEKVTRICELEMEVEKLGGTKDRNQDDNNSKDTG